MVTAADLGFSATDDPVAALRAELKRANELLGIAPPPAAGFAPVPIGDLLHKHYAPDDYLWAGRLVRGTVSMVAAKPKVGKSTFARNLALAVARGEPFLGGATKQGDVIYLALEEREQEVAGTFRALGATGTEPLHVHAAPTPEAGIFALADMVRARKPALVIVDPVFRLARIRDEKAYGEVYAALGPLIDLAREVGAHVMLLHHSGKSARSDAIDAPLGSTALAGAVATLLVMKRTEAYRTLQSVQRAGPDMPETVLSFDPATMALGLAGTKTDADRQTSEGDILGFLAESAEPQTQAQIREAVEGQTRLVRAALTALVTAGKVARTGDGTRGKPFLYIARNGFPNTGSQHIAGTRKPKSQKAGFDRINTGSILVPGFEQKPILVPGTESAENAAPAATQSALWEGKL